MLYESPGSLMGMGNPLLDISANVPQSVLDKYDLKLDTAILAEEKHMPLYKEIIDNYDVKYIAGGATQNSCRVAQWMLQAAGKPNQVAFLGCVGNNDAYCQQLQDCTTADGVLAHYQKDETAPTGTCAALILGGERCLVANLAAANNFQPSHLADPKSQEIIESAQIYYCAGFFLTVSVESLVQVAQGAVEAGKIFCLNLSAPFIVEFFKDQLATAMPYADYLFGNESEAAAYAKSHGMEDKADDIAAIALAIAALPKVNSSRPRTVVFTQGSKSTVAVCNGQVTEYPVEMLAKDKLVDTNGAGDAFVGGFLAQLVLGQDVVKAVDAGHYAARQIIQVSGTTLEKSCDYNL